MHRRVYKPWTTQWSSLHTSAQNWIFVSLPKASLTVLTLLWSLTSAMHCIWCHLEPRCPRLFHDVPSAVHHFLSYKYSSQHIPTSRSLPLIFRCLLLEPSELCWRMRQVMGPSKPLSMFSITSVWLLLLTNSLNVFFDPQFDLKKN